jgi:hypothetical protein
MGNLRFDLGEENNTAEKEHVLVCFHKFKYKRSRFVGTITTPEVVT